LIRGFLGRVEVGDGLPVRILCVLNVSPESFYKGSVVTTREGFREFALRAVSEGCDAVDVGGRSTAPYLATEVPVDVEVERVVGAIKAIREVVDIPISVDTFRARVAEEALKLGAEIVNDVTGLKGDPGMLRVVRDYQPSLIVCARESKPNPGKPPIDRVIGALEESLELLSRVDFDFRRVTIDPCIGFHRYPEIPWYVWDLSVIANLKALRKLGRPIAIGVSRKSFIGVITGREQPEDRLYGSLAYTVIAVLNGAHVVRTHDAAATRDAIRAIEGFKRFNVSLEISYP